MVNNRYNYFKTFKKVQNYLNEAAMRWKDLNGCYPSVSEFSAFVNKHVEAEVLPFIVNEELNEKYINHIAKFLIEGPDHDFFGIPENATPDEIKTAFRKKAMETHPDTGGDPEKFKEAKEAYDRLRSGKSKRTGATPPPSGGASTSPPPGATPPPSGGASTSPPPGATPPPSSGASPSSSGGWKERIKERMRAGAEKASAGINTGIKGVKTGAKASVPALKGGGKVGLGLAGAIATDVALDEPAEWVAKQFGAEEPGTVQQTKDYIKSPFSGFAAGIPFGLAAGAQGAAGAALATGVEHALRKPSEWAAEKLGSRDKTDVETTSELLRAPLVGAAGGAFFGPAGAAIGAAINTGMAAGKGVATKIWGDEENVERQETALESEKLRARRLRDADTQKQLGISPEEAERRIEAGAPKQGGEFLGLATAGNITGETAEQRKAREENEKQAAKLAISRSQLQAGLQKSAEPFTKSASERAGQAAYDSPFMQDALKNLRQETRSFAGSLNEFVVSAAKAASTVISRGVSSSLRSATSPLGRRIGAMIDEIIPLPHSSTNTASRSYPANRSAPTTPSPLTQPKPYVEPSKIPAEIDVPTTYPLTRPSKAPVEVPVEPSPVTAPKPKVETALATKPKVETGLARSLKRTSFRTPRQKTKTVPILPGFPSGTKNDSEIVPYPQIEDPIQLGLAPGERLGAMKRDPIMSFAGSWITVPTVVNENKLSEKESLRRKISKQKYKVVYIQDGKKIEVFASSIRGVRRAVYEKKQFRVYNSSGSDLTGYFKKLLKQN